MINCSGGPRIYLGAPTPEGVRQPIMLQKNAWKWKNLNWGRRPWHSLGSASNGKNCLRCSKIVLYSWTYGSHKWNDTYNPLVRKTGIPPPRDTVPRITRHITQLAGSLASGCHPEILFPGSSAHTPCYVSRTWAAVKHFVILFRPVV